MPYVVGVDESGTGSWAGPFHVAAVAADVLPFNQAIGRHLRDSKKLSDAKRRAAVPLIKEHAVATAVYAVQVPDINRGPRRAWREAISTVLRSIKMQLWEDANYNLLIDGPDDDQLIARLREDHPPPRFEVEGDDKFPAIMAASILAKTARNDAMLSLASEFPEYGWERNMGYGTPEHRKACREHGVTQHHRRRIRSLRECKGYEPSGEWFEG